MYKPTHHTLLEIEEVQKWHNHLSRKSKVTANVYLRRLGNYCEKFNTTPMEFANRDVDELEDKLDDLVDVMDEEDGEHVEIFIE